MKAIILNSGIGKRMGDETATHPKCMTKTADGATIIERQLKQLYAAGISDAVITTGPFEDELKSHVLSLNIPMNYTFVHNDLFASTNYIYSIYLARECLKGDVLLLHGDLVFEVDVLLDMLSSDRSVVAVSTSCALPEKDFKAVVSDGKVIKIGIEFFDNAVASQPIYVLKGADWNAWLSEIIEFCEKGNTDCYAEKAFNLKSDSISLYPFDFKNRLCTEIDTPEDLHNVIQRLQKHERKNAYVCLSTDVIHGGHINIINRAAQLGELTVGVLSDEAVMSYKSYPLFDGKERKKIASSIKGVTNTAEQNDISYKEIIEKLKPDYIVHGDDWKTGFQKKVREECVSLLNEYGGRLVDIPYSNNEEYERVEAYAKSQLSIPDVRRGRLSKTISAKGLATVIEAHNGITGIIAEKTIVYEDGKGYQFDAMWVSSLCDSTSRGKPDIELVDTSDRVRSIEEIMEVTTKPIIVDGDTGGLTEHFVYTVRTLERIGVSAVIIEDKIGPKRNSLFGNEVVQTQDTIENFCAKIKAGKSARKTKDFLIIARVESLILEQGMEDALARAHAYAAAGADGIMIHSRQKSPDEIFEFVEKFRTEDKTSILVVVPTSFNAVTEEEFKMRGVNVVIYANQLTRSGFPAMQMTAQAILRNHRAKEADEQYCMSIKEIINLIPKEQ